MRFTVKVQIARITNQPELLISFEGRSKLFKRSIETLTSQVAPEHFKWVVFENKLFRYKNLNQEGRRNLDAVFPVWNFGIRDDLHQRTIAPERGNRYKNYLKFIKGFILKFLNTEGFCQIIPLSSGNLVYYTKPGFSIVFKDKNDPLPEIRKS